MIVSANQYRRLRISVLGLGALAQNPWWKASSISPVGLRSLSLVFPRTYSNAAVTAASEIACRVHDEKIGKGRVFHLFRLPSDLEFKIQQDLHGLTADQIPPFELTAFTATLAELAKDVSFQVSEGPQRSGSIDELSGPTAISRLAAIYLNAHAQGICCLPYFE